MYTRSGPRTERVGNGWLKAAKRTGRQTGGHYPPVCRTPGESAPKPKRKKETVKNLRKSITAGALVIAAVSGILVSQPAAYAAPASASQVADIGKCSNAVQNAATMLAQYGVVVRGVNPQDPDVMKQILNTVISQWQGQARTDAQYALYQVEYSC
jgi:hypothetical protein